MERVSAAEARGAEDAKEHTAKDATASQEDFVLWCFTLPLIAALLDASASLPETLINGLCLCMSMGVHFPGPNSSFYPLQPAVEIFRPFISTC